jgi:RimJ/RimL family protein N-acetyltransferase
VEVRVRQARPDDAAEITRILNSIIEVELSLRRQGMAGRLFRATFDAARLKGYEKFFTFIRADNPAALATYRRHGFEVIGTARRQARTKHGYVDEILVEAFL